MTAEDDTRGIPEKASAADAQQHEHDISRREALATLSSLTGLSVTGSLSPDAYDVALIEEDGFFRSEIEADPMPAHIDTRYLQGEVFPDRLEDPSGNVAVYRDCNGPWLGVSTDGADEKIETAVELTPDLARQIAAQLVRVAALDEELKNE
jgi:hypothetical protein